MADLPFSSLRAGAGPSAPAGSVPVGLLLVLKLRQAHHGECCGQGRQEWLRKGCVLERKTLGKKSCLLCTAALPSLPGLQAAPHCLVVLGTCSQLLALSSALSAQSMSPSVPAGSRARSQRGPAAPAFILS